MFGASLTGLDRKKLRRLLALFFLALAVPTGILVYQAYSQLKWEAFHQYRLLAEELAARIDARIVQLIDVEEARSFAEYAFLNVAGDPSDSFLRPSPLSVYPPVSPVPGLVGYFQVDADGVFTTPLVPPAGTLASSYGISAQELEQRLALQLRIEKILDRNSLVQAGRNETVTSGEGGTDAPHMDKTRRDRDVKPRPALEDTALSASAKTVEESLPGQAAFDRLNEPVVPLEQEKKDQAAGTFGRVEDLKLDYRYQYRSADDSGRELSSPAPAAAKRMRKERTALPEPLDESGSALPARTRPGGSPPPSTSDGEIRIRTFESEIDPFEFSLLDSGHFVLYRKVWRDGQRYIQGALIEQQPFVHGLIDSVFQDSAVSGMSDLLVAWRGNVLSVLGGRAAQLYLSSAQELRGTVLYQTRLSAPLNDLELILSVNRLPAGAGARVIAWLVAVLALVLCGGFYLMYRLGAGQIDLTRQQQDFVSAVSHELKTPLTSIRMYGELLREGWPTEERKRLYIDYIYDESERLSRLIENVLQLARLTRNNLHTDTKPLTVAGLMEGIRARVSSQVERAGFELNMSCEPDAGQSVIQANPDWFAQIFINLVDNAVKFSAGAEKKVIDIGCRRLQDGVVLFSVRDYGPGIAGGQMKKIFKLFYRPESELTRETIGTGIGLALVHQLARAMGCKVDVINREPGAEFRIEAGLVSNR
jgi:signal transduction histidine kinase